MVRLSNFYEVRWWDFCFAWGQMKRFLKNVKNPAIVRDQMGHTDITTTNKYISSRDSIRLAEVQKFEY